MLIKTLHNSKLFIDLFIYFAFLTHYKTQESRQVERSDKSQSQKRQTYQTMKESHSPPPTSHPGGSSQFQTKKLQKLISPCELTRESCSSTN